MTASQAEIDLFNDPNIEISYTNEYDPTPEQLKLNFDNVRALLVFFRERIKTNPSFINFGTKIDETSDKRKGEIAVWAQMVLNHINPLGEILLVDPITKEPDPLGPIILLGNTTVGKEEIDKGIPLTLVSVDRWQNPDFDGTSYLLMTFQMPDGVVKNFQFSWQNVFEEFRDEIIPIYTKKIEDMKKDGTISAYREQIMRERHENYVPNPDMA